MKGLISPVVRLTHNMFWDEKVEIRNGDEVIVLGVIPECDSCFVLFTHKAKKYKVGIDAFRFLTE